ncbi:MAG: HNH endonuclease [Planctomycetaceae bacterium]|nr:MAG: HNH endonuclease [Planctomycetaceae bacterium]
MFDVFGRICFTVVSVVICLAGMCQLGDFVVNKLRCHSRLTDTSWQRVRSTVRGRDDEICQYCGQHDASGEVDHVLPLSRGGNDMLENLVWACPECNRLKGDKTPREFIKSLTGKTATMQEGTDLGRMPPITVINDPGQIAEFERRLLGEQDED